MRISEIRVIHARIPLKKRVQHASHSRFENDTLLICCRMDDGSCGWGEGLPRHYVTGETIQTAWQHLQDFDFRSLGQKFDDLITLQQLAAEIAFPRPQETRACFGHAARCALELSILDAGCRSLQIPLSTFIQNLPATQELKQNADVVYYSAVLTAASRWKTRLRSWLYRYYGFRQCKVKVGVPGTDDLRLLMLIHNILGSRVGLRIDVNEAWPPQDVTRQLQNLSSVPLQSVEQPVPHAHVGVLKKLRPEISIPIMLDESLCSLEDADRAIGEELCDAFNLRLSKCGGILTTIELARQARQAGLTFQLGCQVGETGILSAAGRHFATSIHGLTAVEGSFDRLLVEEPLTREDLTFQREGQGSRLPGNGLGITIDDTAVQRVTMRSHSVSLS